MADEDAAIPQEQSERVPPPPRPPRTAVGAPLARWRDAAPFQSTGAAPLGLPWRQFRGALAAAAGLVLLGGVLRLFAEAPEMRWMGGWLVLAGGLWAVVIALVMLALHPRRLPSFPRETRGRP